jgi:hypothetical protein
MAGEPGSAAGTEPQPAVVAEPTAGRAAETEPAGAGADPGGRVVGKGEAVGSGSARETVPAAAPVLVPAPAPAPVPVAAPEPASSLRDSVFSDLVVVLAPDPGPDFVPDAGRVRRDRRITRRIVCVVQLLLCVFLSWSINNLGIAMCDGESDCRDQAALLQPWVLGLAGLSVVAFGYGAVRRDRDSQTRVQGVLAAAVLLTVAIAVGHTFSGVVWKPAGPDQIEQRNPSDYQNVPECRDKGMCPPAVTKTQ